jgi:hypothetical protein
MPTFHDDVVIEEHRLVLLDANGGEVASLEQAGELVLHGDVTGTLTQLLRFVAATARLVVGDPTRAGEVVVQSAQGDAIVLRGSDATAVVGTTGEGGDLLLNDASGQPAVAAHGAGASVEIGAGGNAGGLSVLDGNALEVLRVAGANAAVYVGAAKNEGDVIVRDNAGRDVIHADGGNAALYVGATENEGDVIVRDNAGRAVIHADGSNAALYVGATGGEREGNEGDVIVRDSAGRDVIHLDGGNAVVYVGQRGNEGDVIVLDGEGRQVFHVDGNYAAVYVGADGNEGDVIVRDGAGVDRIHLNGSSGDIRLMGADVAEDFEPDGAIEPGSVVVAVAPDRAATTSVAHDRRVIGVASGAGDLQPALRLATRAEATERVPIAIAGRVHCKVDADLGPVVAGDLLTTSVTDGYAMRAHPAAAAGAIVGKALAPLPAGRGLIPVLLTLR